MPYAINGSVSTERLVGAIEISDAQYRAAVEGMCEGMLISIAGGVLSIDFPPPPDVPPPAPFPPPETVERAWRDAELTSVMWLRERHRDQLEIDALATLTGEQFTELLVYIQALRDWPQSPDFPQIEHRPTAPEWLAEQVE